MTLVINSKKEHLLNTKAYVINEKSAHKQRSVSSEKFINFPCLPNIKY